MSILLNMSHALMERQISVGIIYFYYLYFHHREWDDGGEIGNKNK